MATFTLIEAGEPPLGAYFMASSLQELSKKLEDHVESYQALLTMLDSAPTMKGVHQLATDREGPPWILVVTE